MYAEAILKKGEGRTLKSGGAWVYDNEIDRVEGDYENGDILAVKDFDGFFLGWGFITSSAPTSSASRLASSSSNWG